MLGHWLIAMTLGAFIILTATQGLLLLGKIHSGVLLLANEQAQMRVLVGYFRGIFQGGIDNPSPCLSPFTQPVTVVPVTARQDLLLRLQYCQPQAPQHTRPPLRFFVAKSPKKAGLTLFVQVGEERREALLSGLKSMTVQYCGHTRKGSHCVAAATVDDWLHLSAVEVSVQFLPNAVLDELINVKNFHHWRFRLKIGGPYASG